MPATRNIAIIIGTVIADIAATTAKEATRPIADKARRHTVPNQEAILRGRNAAKAAAEVVQKLAPSDVASSRATFQFHQVNRTIRYP